MAYVIIAVEESDSSVGFYHSTTGAEIARVAVGTWPHEIAVSTDRLTAYVSNFGIKDYDEHIGQPGASVSVLDLEQFAERNRLFTFRGERDYPRRLAPHSVILDESRNRLLVNVEAEDALVTFDLAGNGGIPAAQAFGEFGQGPAAPLPDSLSPLPKGTHAMLLSPDGERLYLGCGPGGLVELEAATGRLLRTLHPQGAVRGLAFTVDHRQLIVSAGGSVCVVDPTTLTVVRRYDFPVAQFLYPTPTPDGRSVLVPAVWEGMLYKIDMASGEAESLVVGADPIHLSIPDGDDFAYLGHGRSPYISRIDWRIFREDGRIATRGGPNGLDWMPLRERPKRERLRLGAAIPLSGPSRSEGHDLRLGYQFWAEQVNSAGGMVCGETVYEVEILFADTLSKVGTPTEPPLGDGTPTAEYLRRIADRLVDDGAIALLGSYPSPPHFALREVAEARKVPLVTASGAASKIYSDGFSFVFGIMTAATGFLNESFDLLARQQPRPRTVLFLSCEDPAAFEDSETTARHVEENLGMTVIGGAGEGAPLRDRIERFRHNQQQFDEAIERAALLDPDVLAITGHLGESVAAGRALAAHGWAPKAVLFSVGPAMPAFVQQLGPVSEHLMGSAMWSRDQKSFGHDRFITPAAFRDAFFDRFSKEPSHLAAGATACGLVIEEALRLGGSAEPEAIAEALRSRFAMRSFYSPVELDGKGLNSSRRLLTVQLREVDGEIRQVALWPPSLAGSMPDKPVWPFPGWPSQRREPHH
ncbi:MAG: ABC transporter substrate-binding protein [Allosphingosinicella sp.]|uniref:ABC transporter substrate-binding protein n=1 Tax=Allosphingosinicella sp. TaxID=2823234 RepID=UPI003936E76F